MVYETLTPTNFFLSVEVLLQSIPQNDRNDQLNSFVGTKNNLGTWPAHKLKKTREQTIKITTKD